MDGYGHDVGRAVGKPNAGSGKRHLHHLARKITSRMSHGLIRGGDTSSRGVIIGAEMRGNAAASRGGDQGQDLRFAALVENRLRRLDHQLDAQASGFEVQQGLETRTNISERRDFIRQSDLRQRDAKVCGQFAARLACKLRKKYIQSANAARAKLLDRKSVV